MVKARILQKSTFLALVLILLALSIACHPEPVAPQEARILIIDPAAESVIDTTTITIKTFVERFNLVDKTGQPNSPGEGHIVYYKDVTPPLVEGQSALTAEGSYIISMESSETWNNLQPGKHTFWVQLVNNDNTPLLPPAAVRVYVTVKEQP
jgi:hypothetical protein